MEGLGSGFATLSFSCEGVSDSSLLHSLPHAIFNLLQDQMNPELREALEIAIRALLFHRDSWQHFVDNPSMPEGQDAFKELVSNDNMALEVIGKELMK